MLKVILKKRVTQASAGILVMLLLVIVTVALASQGEGYIKAKKGGTIVIDDDTCLIIPRNALKHDTFITAKVVYNKNKVMFHFEPEGLIFRRRVYLQKSMEGMEDVEDLEDVEDAEDAEDTADLQYLTLYYAPDEENPDYYTEEIEPTIDDENVTWSLRHFSLYYHRRR